MPRTYKSYSTKPKRPTDSQIAEIYWRNACNLTKTAQKIGISRSTIADWVGKRPTLAKMIEEKREGMKDFAESALFQRMAEKDTTAIIFFLKTQAKDRGYIERQDINVNTTDFEFDLGVPITFQEMTPVLSIETQPVPTIDASTEIITNAIETTDVSSIIEPAEPTSQEN